MPASRPRRRHYGIAEIADALELNRQLVTVWRRRRSWGMPEPDDELASGPLWLGETIEPWIDEMRARQARDSAEPLDADLARRTGRRLLRLCALLLADEPRPQLVKRAHAELTETADAVRACAPGPDRDRLLTALDQALAGETGSLTGCLTALGEVAPMLRQLVETTRERH